MPWVWDNSPCGMMVPMIAHSASRKRSVIVVLTEVKNLTIVDDKEAVFFDTASEGLLSFINYDSRLINNIIKTSTVV